MNPAIMIYPLLCGQDNFIYLLIDTSGQAIVIDPGQAELVESAVEKQKLKLTHILLTHHHADHIGGAETLKAKYACRVIGPDSQRISGVDDVVRDNQVLRFPEFAIRVLFTPGHTRSSVCYVVNSASVFTGDTLFVCGCGRCFEGTPHQMHESLMKLAALPDDILVYPGHDYTADNYRFALTVEPDNAITKKCFMEIEARGSLSANPSTIGLEKQTNPFLRTHSESIRKTLAMPDAADWDVFGLLRSRKNIF